MQKRSTKRGPDRDDAGGRASKPAKRPFGRVSWPMQWKNEQDGCYVYKMDPTAAKWWEDARQQIA
ncbi:hypothetical protein SAMN06272737_15210 [Blastococcus mobilis]|uniref:Uncharacterized protein n=1 Tax=Blastococcus mobilis TaxID=1938746 RepID=A0A239APT9_9ACTN|nr:hypothetical protein SAMN06272737_15210 [Blastococcus mobilis]